MSTVRDRLVKFAYFTDYLPSWMGGTQGAQPPGAWEAFKRNQSNWKVSSNAPAYQNANWQPQPGGGSTYRAPAPAQQVAAGAQVAGSTQPYGPPASASNAPYGPPLSAARHLPHVPAARSRLQQQAAAGAAGVKQEQESFLRDGATPKYSKTPEQMVAWEHPAGAAVAAPTPAPTPATAVPTFGGKPLRMDQLTDSARTRLQKAQGMEATPATRPDRLANVAPSPQATAAKALQPSIPVAGHPTAIATKDSHQG